MQGVGFPCERAVHRFQQDSTEHTIARDLVAEASSAGDSVEDQFFDADAAPSPPDDEAVYGGAAKEGPSTATRSTSATYHAHRNLRSSRQPSASAAAVELGRRIVDGAPACDGSFPKQRRARRRGTPRRVARGWSWEPPELLHHEIQIVDGSIQNTDSRFVTIAERLDRVERATTNPAAQLPTSPTPSTAQRSTPRRTTGSIAPMTTPPADPKIVDRIVEDSGGPGCPRRARVGRRPQR